MESADPWLSIRGPILPKLYFILDPLRWRWRSGYHDSSPCVDEGTCGETSKQNHKWLSLVNFSLAIPRLGDIHTITDFDIDPRWGRAAAPY